MNDETAATALYIGEVNVLPGVGPFGWNEEETRDRARYTGDGSGGLENYAYFIVAELCREHVRQWDAAKVSGSSVAASPDDALLLFQFSEWCDQPSIRDNGDLTHDDLVRLFLEQRSAREGEQ